MSFAVNSGGLGDYINWFPCPYDQIVDPGSALPAVVSAAGLSGLGCGCVGMGCGCAGLQGLTMDGTGLFGTGIFSGGMDFSTWGAWEFGVAALGAYVLYSMLFTARHGAQAVGSAGRRVKGRAKAIKRGFTGPSGAKGK